VKIPQKLQERLQFLARVIERESTHLQDTDQRFSTPNFMQENAQRIKHDTELVKRVGAVVSRFRRLQDTLGDKLLPVWRSAVGEVPATLADNRDRAELLELIAITRQAAGESFA